jgi:lysozyme
MKTSGIVIELIKEFEALRLEAYQDTGGVWTVGWGHTANAYPGKVITENEAKMYLQWDIEDTEAKLDGLNLLLNQNQYDALISFIFNIGIGRFKRSTMLKRLRENINHPDIPIQFKRWIYDAGKIQPGLVRRRNIESALYVS